MVTLQPGHVVNDLIIILDGELRSIRIRTDVHSEFINRDVGKVRTKTRQRKCDIRHRNRRIGSTKRQPYFIGQTRGESVNVRVREEVGKTGWGGKRKRIEWAGAR